MSPPEQKLLLVAVAVIASGLLLRLAPVRADELPEGTDKIESLTPEQALGLVKKFPGVELEIENKRSAQWKLSSCLPLKGLKSLDPDTAKALAGYDKGPLVLSGLTTLDADTAKGLAEFKGPYLYLSGLTTLDANTAKVLAEFKGYELFLNGLTTLDAEAAKALAGFTKWTGDLSAVTILDSPDSVAIAKALATRKGPLSLPNLKKISPKTLTALIQKKDVEIPLIETLELIQEPDGSATDDFVIPEWLEKWQKQKSGVQAAE